MAVLGIDLGTTNSLAAVWKDGGSLLIPNALGETLTPSAVSVDEDGTLLVGRVAAERLISHPNRTATSFKRHMGTSRTFDLGGHTFTPEELSSIVLRRLREDAEAFLGEQVEEAVISVPAYFNDNQRYATKQAGRLAGLRVDRLVNEPSAAALAGRFHKREEDACCLVVDMGGGTLDISIVECFDDVVEILAVAGDNELGGGDFDRIITDYFCRENDLEFHQLDPVCQGILLRQAEQCKRALSRERAAYMLLERQGGSWGVSLTNEMLIQLSAPLLDRLTDVVRRVLTDSRKKISSINEVVLVGGSCNMPIVRKYIAHLLRREGRFCGSPETVVARGTGVYTGIKERSGVLRDLLLTDICPFTMGIAVYNPGEPGQSQMSPVIERNSTLPTSKVKHFHTVWDNQKAVTVEVYQGESLYCADNLHLGKLKIEVPPAPAGREGIAVRFTYDINGILEVEVSSDSTGEIRRDVIVSQYGRMEEADIERRLEEMKALKIHPADKEENRLLLARGERLYAETLGSIREHIAMRVSSFKQILSEQEELRIRRERELLARFLDRVEDSMLSYGELEGAGGEA